MKPQSQIIIAALIALGVVARLAVAPWWAHPIDIMWYIRWAETIQQHGWANVYLTSRANYPPFSMALLGLAARLELILGAGLSAEANLRLWRVLIKLPMILADAGIAATVWHIARGRRGAALLVAAVVFNPALFYLSAAWGQLDSTHGLAALLAVWLALEGRPFWSGLSLGVGAMFKPQALVSTPIVGLIALAAALDAFQTRRSHEPSRRFRLADLAPVMSLALGFALPVLINALPLILTGRFATVVERIVTYPEPMSGWLTINAHNLWYLATWGEGNWGSETLRSYNPLIFGLTYKTVGRLMVAGWTALVCALAWRKRRSPLAWLLAAALLYFGVFELSTGMTERYLFGAAPLLAGAAAWSLRDGEARTRGPVWALFGMLSLFHALNLIWATPQLDWPMQILAPSTQIGAAIALGITASGASGLMGLAVLARLTRNAATPEDMRSEIEVPES